MTRDFANLVLDAVKAGKQHERLSHIVIRRALVATGDLPKEVHMPSSRRMPNYGATR
jgi:hypothetical protein